MISKKDLLLSMNISYGQLYRWKRQELIPDEWFIKTSVSTGQETYFDESLIIPRIQKILELKDNYPLDDLKAILNPKRNKEVMYFKDDLRGYVDEKLIKLCGISLMKGIDISKFAFLFALTSFMSSYAYKFNDNMNSFLIELISDKDFMIENALINVYDAKGKISIQIAHKPQYIIGSMPLWDADLGEKQKELLILLKEGKGK